jgi:hypothetical protein
LEIRNAYTILVIKHEGKRSFGRLRCKHEDNIKMRVQAEFIWFRSKTVGSSHKHGNESCGSINGKEFLGHQSTCQLLKELINLP